MTLPNWWLLLLYFWRILHSEYQTLEGKYYSLKMTENPSLMTHWIWKTKIKCQAGSVLGTWIPEFNHISLILNTMVVGYLRGYTELPEYSWLSARRQNRIQTSTFHSLQSVTRYLKESFVYCWTRRRLHQCLQTPPAAFREKHDFVCYAKPVGFCSWMCYVKKAHPTLQRQSRLRKKRTWEKRRLKKQQQSKTKS